MPRNKALISWSSGKDSAFSLAEVRRSGEFEVVGALTTVSETFDRVSIHGVRQEILRAQCEAAGLPQHIVRIPYPCSNEIYEARMGVAIAEAVAADITHIIFGDLFLAEIRSYREQKLAGTGITPLFPLWLRPTLPLAQAMIQSGLEAYLATVDLKKTAGRICRAQIRCPVAGRPAHWHRSLRRKWRISYLRGGGTDVRAPAFGDDR
jgi:diphthamide synthase (EF-2-diphthine--ammonia ligase)